MFLPRHSTRLFRAVEAGPKSTVYVLPIDPGSVASSGSQNAPVDASALWASALVGNKSTKVGTNRIFYGENGTVVVSSVGDKFGQKTGNVRRELVRKVVGSAVKAVKNLESSELDLSVHVDASLDPHASAVAAHLARYKFTLKTDKSSGYGLGSDTRPNELMLSPIEQSTDWFVGVAYAEAQNLARTLTDLPGNMMTPTIFAERLQVEFSKHPNISFSVHDTKWAQQRDMNAFLSVAKGATEPAKFVEIEYHGGQPEDKPIAFVGKGVTFDSGGISIKPAANMKLMRGDMGGAAAVAAATLGIAQLKLPINVVTIIPLTENMPGPSAMKPGDVVYAMNGKSVEIDNTDAEGRLILADALYYASTVYRPQSLIDVATLTGAIDVALGDVFTGAYTANEQNSDELWKELHAAGEAEHDRFWRMPLDSAYSPQITSSNADLCNTGGRSAGSCTAALFLKSFIDGVEAKADDGSPAIRWAHLDIAGSMQSTHGSHYQDKGMTGRPVRALIEWANRLAKRK
ncbi:leucine aminopeptidase [Vararia minispora EC-137]|uniref:Leucine aminopeptidase n=1 Tax=Vararia minispora EC-137 TaxID=1314806 RepID=A0ACB8QGH7_9AGAM|nr:leucine aminopeptidase [Vararia minispora EC-137]